MNEINGPGGGCRLRAGRCRCPAQGMHSAHEPGGKGQGKITARARAEIKGEGITGTAEFVETDVRHRA